MTEIQNCKKEFPRLQSIDRISKIPVVETSVQYASGMYWRIKNLNALMRWSFQSVEGGLQMAVEKSLSAVPLLEMPIFIVDSIVCKSLDTVEQRVPAINYPPELLINMTKDMVTARIVQPAIKRVDSVKQFSVNGASKYTEIAATHLDSALHVADKYVDKYLPDATDASDSTDSKDCNIRRDSKASQTIEHANRLTKKLQRRLTKRTIAEAQALKKQGVDVAQFLLYLLDLMIRDPKQFAEKIKAIWAYLSQDEPENQIPPANLEQLIAMLTREMARRIVHVTNYTALAISHLPTFTVQVFNYSQHHLAVLIEQVSKTVHLEGAQAIAVARARTEVESLQTRMRQFYDLLQHLMDNMGSKIASSPVCIPLKSIEAKNEETEAKKEETEAKNEETESKNEETPVIQEKNEAHQEINNKKKKGKNHHENSKKDKKISEGDENSNKKINQNLVLAESN